MKKKFFWITGIIVIALIGVAVIGLNYTGSNTSQFTGPVSTDESLPRILISDLEKYVRLLMRQMDVPGLSMVLVEGDQVIYERSLGVRDLETKEPVTTRTLFGIASTTKSMTAVMIASLVDEGIITWDTPLADVLQSFSLSNPEVAQKMTFRHTLCMCSSVPEHKEAITVQYSEMTAEDVIEMMAFGRSIEPYTPTLVVVAVECIVFVLVALWRLNQDEFWNHKGVKNERKHFSFLFTTGNWINDCDSCQPWRTFGRKRGNLG